MSVRNLDALFEPRSVVVVGASARPGKVGNVVVRNLLRGGFGGPILPVNPKYEAVCGVLAYPSVADLPLAPDLAVLCTPPATLPGLVAELGARGTRAAIVLTGGLAGAEPGRDLEAELCAAARPHLLRVLGPNCLGLLAPHAGLDASFAEIGALAGDIALVSQSGGLCTGLLDWARPAGIGFSHVVSLGNALDVDFGDVLDYLGSDPRTRSILLYMESLRGARKFVSAARAAARNKPVVAIKAGRVADGERAAASHTGALAGSDEVFDAALARAGVLRVDEIDELFDAVETLARAGPLRGERLLVVTNGGGPAVMATDALVRGGGRLAQLSPATLARLDAVLPATWSRANPVDIIGDASGERFSAALAALAHEPGADAFLVLHAPTALATGVEAAHAVARAAPALGRPVLTSWLGRQQAESARRVCAEAGLPTYPTPGHAVAAFLRMVRHRQNQTLLQEAPASGGDGACDVERASSAVLRGLGEGRDWLAPPLVEELLAAYGLPLPPTRVARSAAEAAALADELGFPVALKVLSPQVVHKSDVGGVALDLADRAAVSAAARAMAARLAELRPDAELEGFTVQRMARRPGAHELIVGFSSDPIFGPFVLFGEGGTAVEVVADKAIGLPPLNAVLARDLVRRTRIHRRLAGYRDRPAIDFAALESALVQVARIASDHPDVAELEINPLLADERGVLALDARVRLERATGARRDRLAIRPYPRELEEVVTTRGGLRVLLRPIRPEDEPRHQEFFARLAPEDVRFRFFHLVKELPHSEMARYTQIDYDREMAFVAVEEDGRGDTLGVARAVVDPDGERAEFAVVVRSDLKGKGLGHALLAKLVRYLRARGVKSVVGRLLADNAAMLELARSFGFVLAPLAAKGAQDAAGEREIRLALRPSGT